jgi:glycosyltransferase involved in cell wall biosynthesis
MLNILHLGKYYYPAKGGIETVVKNLAEYSARQGNFVTVLCFSQVNGVEHISNVKIVKSRQLLKLNSQPISFVYFFQGIYQSWKADIIHVHTPNFLALFILIFLKSKSNIIIHWHSDVIIPKVNPLLKCIEELALKKSNRIICTSMEYAQTSRPLSPFFEKITIIPIGIEEPNTITMENNQFQDLETIIAERSVILSVGRLVPYKGFKYLIEASKHFQKDIVTIIVGSGPEYESLQCQIDESNLSNNVILTGQLSDERLKYLYTRAKIFCLPSINRSEAFGVVLIEAMSYKLPLVTFDIPGSGVTSLNKDYYNGRIAKLNNSKSLYSCLNYLVNHVDKRIQYGKNSFFDFSTLYTNNKSCERTNKLYESLLTL